MKHVTDEEMIGQVYGEGENTAAVARHLADCRECAENFAELQRDLAALNRAETPARDARYGERVWASIAPLLPVYRMEKRRWWSNGLVKGLGYAAACALLVSCAFYAGRVWEQKQLQQQPVAQVQPKVPQIKQPIVVVVLDDHLDRSERFLVELKHADLDSAAMDSPMRDEARSLLASNRVCRRNAAEARDPELTTALDHLDRLLAEAANEPDGLNAQTIARLQDEMNADGVLFEVRVLRSRIARHEGPGNNPAKGGTI
ncbi:MAG TPA: hypothetical protein VGG56_05045 [Terracidiphilus sp.]|jgi:hypothetical protein